MNELSSFVVNNIWLVLGVGVIFVVIADEVLGLSRNLLGDETETVAQEQRREREAAEEEDEDPLDRLGETGEGARVEDFLDRR